MGRKFKVETEITARDRATPVVAKAEGRFKRFGSFLRDRFVITLGDVQRAFSAVVSAMRGFIVAAQTQEDAVRKLDASLADLGDGATRVSSELQQQASALQEVTRFGDEAIIRAQAYLRTLGVQVEQLPKATQATVDLAAALGVDLVTAARNVGKTVGGFAGELGEVIPELKALDQEALRAGAGIELLADKFAGRAEEDVKTFSGALDQLTATLGDLQEEIGSVVTKNASFRGAIGSATQAVREAIPGFRRFVEFAGPKLAAAFNLATAPMRFFIDNTARAVAAVDGLVQSFNRAEPSAAALEATAERLGISVDELRERLEAARIATREGADASRTLAAAQDEAAAATNRFAAAAERAAAAQARDKAELEAIREQAERLGVTLTADVNLALDENVTFLERVRVAARAGVVDWRDYEAVALAVSEENGRLRQELFGVAEGAEVAGKNVKNISRDLSEFNGRQGQTTFKLNQVANSFRAAAQAAAIFNAQVGASGVVARTPSAQAEVDAAIAAGFVPILGGTRIRLPGGGSRLLGSRGFGG